MKFCTKCGAQLVDGAQFCANCGAAYGQPAQHFAVEPEPQPVPVVAQEKKQKKSAKKGKVIAILCAVVLLIGAAVGGYFALQWYNSPEQQLLRALKAGQYEEALDIVDEDSSLKYSENLSDSLKKRIETVKADYISAAMEYANVMMELDTIAEIDIKELRELITETRNYVEKLNASRTAFSTAETFFASADYVEAIAQYKQVIQEDSNYATAMAKANEAVTLYRTKVLSDAEIYATAENYVNAITLLQSALINLPEDAQVTQQLLLYEKALENQILTIALNEAAQYATSKDYLSAMARLERYMSENGENAEVAVAWNTYRDAYVDMVLADAAVYGDAEAYTNAIALLNNALKECPGNSKLTAQLTAYEKAYQEQQLSEALAKAEAYADRGDYLSAMNVLSTYTADYGSNASVVVALNEYTDKYADAVLAEAETHANDGDYPSAITALQTGLSNTEKNAKLLARLDSYSNAYAAKVIAESETLLEKRNYEEAMMLIQSAQLIIPDHSMLLEQAEKVETYKPVCLTDIHTIDAGYYVVGDQIDAFGNNYQTGFSLGSYYHWCGSVSFNLAGEYTILVLVIAPAQPSDDKVSSLQISADGEVIFSVTIESTTAPQVITLDITGCTVLEFERTDGGGMWGDSVIIGDPYVQK